VIAELGPAHDRRFVVAAVLAGVEAARAEGRSKKEAEQQAAAAATFRLESGARP
jgi:ribonuclease-3